MFLDGSGIIVITEGFSRGDAKIIGGIIFNTPEDGEISNDKFLEGIWEELHNDKF